MHLKEKHLNTILNIFLGVAWATTFYSFFSGYASTNGNFLIKISSAIIHFVFALGFVVLVEMVFKFFENSQLQKENNKLLKELLEKQDS